jgi:hypothetical protein
LDAENIVSAPFLLRDVFYSSTFFRATSNL